MLWAENLRMTAMARGPLVLKRGRAERSAWLRLLVRVLLDRLWLRRVGECGKWALADRVWCLGVLRRRSWRMRRRVLLEARRYAALVHLVGRRRLLLLLLASMAHRPTARCASRVSGVWRILLAGMCHRALRWMLWKRVLARRSMRRRL